jgi:hypothetical protein
MTNAAAAPTWPCAAYGPEGHDAGAWCFLSAESRTRVCGSQGECQQQMAGERQRVFRRINELAAAGGEDFGYLAEEFASPQQLLNADD